MGRAGSLQGPPVPRRAFEEPRDSPVPAQKRGGAGWGWEREGAIFREGAGWGQFARPVLHPPGHLSAQGTAGGGAHAHTLTYRLHKAPRAHAPPCSCSHPAAQAAHTLHLHSLQTRGHTQTPGAGARGRGTPESHPYSHTHTQTEGPRRSTAAQTHCTPAALSHRLPRLHADAPERDGWMDARSHESRRRPRMEGRKWRPAWKVAPSVPCPGVRSALPPVPLHARTHCWPRCG